MLKILALAAILLTTFFVFRACLHHEFLEWDDGVHVWDNPVIKNITPSSLQQMFTGTVNKTYIPLTSLSFAIEYRLVADNPFLYHLDNILLHLGVVSLVFLLALSLDLPLAAAACAALIFALHPMRVETVAWVTERKGLLYSMFYLLSLLQYIHYLRSGKMNNYMLSLGAALLSILSKPMAISLPLALLLVDWFFKRKFSAKTLIDKAPYGLMMMAFGWVTYSTHARMPVRDILESAITWTWTFTFYIRQFIFPENLAPLYDFPRPVTLANPYLLISFGLFMAIVWAVLRFRRHRWFMFAMGFYFLSIFFLLRLDLTADTEIVADRYMYLPSLGFCLLAGYAFNRLIEQRSLLVWLAIPLFIYLGTSSFQKSLIWKSDLTLGQATITLHRARSIIFNNIGNYFYKKGQVTTALAVYNRATEINPEYYGPYANRGKLYLEHGQIDLALKNFTEMLRYKEDYVGYNNRGCIYLKTGQVDKAMADFNRSLEFNPSNIEAYFNRGELYRLTGRPNEALREYTRALQINPRDVPSYLQRAVVYETLQAFVQARANYIIALKLSPQNAQALDGIRRLGQ